MVLVLFAALYVVVRPMPVAPVWLPSEHDPEKWEPVFGKDHAPAKAWSGMTIRRNVIPLHVVAEGRAHGVAGDAEHRVRARMPGRRIAVVADVRLGQQVADRVVGEVLHQRGGGEVDARGGEPVERVVGETFGDAAVAVGAAERIAERVVG